MSLRHHQQQHLGFITAVSSPFSPLSTHTFTRKHIQGAANKSNPLPCFVHISTTNLNFYKKIYVAISHSYLHINAKLCCIIATFD